MDVSSEIERCDREIEECLAYLERGGPQESGALLGYCDWRWEREILMEEKERL